MMIAVITRRGVAVFSASLLIPACGVLVPIPLLELSLLYLSALCVLLGIVFREYLRAKKGSQACEVLVRCDPLLHCAQDAHLQVTIAMTQPFAQCWVKVIVPEGSRCLDPVVTCTSPRELPFRSEHTLSFTPFVRGTHVISTVMLRTIYGTGLVAWQEMRTLSPLVSATVIPGGNDTETGSDHTTLKNFTGQKKTVRVLAGGREFEALKRYVPGDDVRKIDWKRSAGGKGLLTKVFKPESHQRIVIALDCGRRMSNRIGEMTQLDYGINGAAHLAKVALRAHDEVGLYAFGHIEIARVQSDKGAGQYRKLVEVMTPLQPSPLESDYALVAECARRFNKRALFVIITSLSTPAQMEALRHALVQIRAHHLPLVMALADEDLATLAYQPAGSVVEAYQSAAALEDLRAIAVRVAALRRSGIECVHCNANEFGLKLEERYLHAKQSGRW